MLVRDPPLERFSIVTIEIEFLCALANNSVCSDHQPPLNLLGMPSYLHESLLLLFRNSLGSATDLLRELHIQLPEYDELRAESSDLTHLEPAEYRADLVLFLLRRAQKLLGIVVEIQVSRDQDKPYAWPAYIANLRARHRCPVCLLVVTIEPAVARWAERPINIGPGSTCTPWVVGPTNTPAITDMKMAQGNVELAVLSAIEHGRGADKHLAESVTSAAISAIHRIDAERSRRYFDLLYTAFSTNAPEVLTAVMKNSLGFEYQSDFARRYVAQGQADGLKQGRAEGKAEGRVELLLKLLALRFGPLTAETQICVSGAQEANLDALAAQMLTAQTLEEALETAMEIHSDTDT
jgi:hypothetical protein